jgi:hypothetical protein
MTTIDTKAIEKELGLDLDAEIIAGYINLPTALYIRVNVSLGDPEYCKRLDIAIAKFKAQRIMEAQEKRVQARKAVDVYLASIESTNSSDN